MSQPPARGRVCFADARQDVVLANRPVLQVESSGTKKDAMGMNLTKYIWTSCAGIMPRCTKAMGNRAATKDALRCMLTMALMVLASVHTSPAQAINTTTVQGTVYLANGQPGAGTLVVSWPSFTTSSGQVVAADSMNVPIAPDGFVSVSLAPNLGATPGESTTQPCTT